MSDTSDTPGGDPANDIVPATDPPVIRSGDPEWLDEELGPVDYVFGYGSLIQSQSRQHTLDVVGVAFPVRIEGLRRAWNVQGPDVGFSATFLGVTRDADAACNGVLAPVYPNEWPELDARERNYRRVELSEGQIEWLGPRRPDLSGPSVVAFYEAEAPAPPSDRFPVLQSYIDICVDGCLAIDELLRTGDRFAREFLATTDGWGPEWVNDRLYPRAPFRTVRRAGQIDRLLAERAPAEFAAIRIE